MFLRFEKRKKFHIESTFFAGMINNFQRDAGLEDDRDSGSVSLISPLEQGDQVTREY